MQRFATFLFCAFIASTTPTSSHADPCDPALVPDLPSLVPHSTVKAMTPWDPDRSGPLRQRLVVAGGFSVANVPNSTNIAAWDGAQWHTFGPGLTNAPTVVASIFGDVIVGGADIKPVGGTSLGALARWNGNAWQSLNSNVAPEAIRGIRALGDWLYVVGDFNIIGGQSALRVARWNGLAWQKLGNGLNGTISALEVFNGELVVGGAFTASGSATVKRVARWDGFSWQPFGNGPPSNVSSMTVHNGQLVVNSGGSLLLWNGTTWERLVTEYVPSEGVIRSHNGRLYVASYWFSEPQFRGITCWDGTTWSSMQGGLMGGSSPATVYCFEEFEGDLFAAGQISNAGDAPASGFARWTGTTWRSIGSGWSKYPAERFFVTTEALYAADWENNIAVWDNQEWAALPPVTNPDGYRQYFRAQNTLHAATMSGDGGRVFRFRAGQWEPFDGVFSSYVRDIVELQDDIVASGPFTSVGGAAAKGVARWSGSQWIPMGSDFSPSSLIVHHGQLHAIGLFSQRPTWSPRDFARWDGNQWISLDMGHSPDATKLILYRDQIVALTATSLFVWNGSEWSPMTPPSSGTIYTATVFGGRLIVGGSKIGASGNALVEWTGTDWRMFGPPLRMRPDTGSAIVYGLDVFENTLLVGGNFEEVGTQQVSYFARITACSLCPADLTNDSLVDDADFCAFILSYDLMDCSEPAMPASCPSDFNADGFVDDADFTRFVADYAAFLCPDPH